ncbi:hypothetical protein NP493_1467g00024 [Ridgeia piscesae]|uniref:Major facilitator superfamily (MFS) profile domain-containing protein n=1 Tax=Ridgeia piscesae TaxID=27915 RepID=A0AAD9NCP8_RIDPI|nr:hypothetical protein NP493_1467g00024 [Ridgeia piscesae]
MIHFLVVGGCVSSFGVFFKTIQDTYVCTASDVAWIPAIMAFVAFMTVPPANLLSSRFGPKPVVVFGGLLMNIGYFLTAFAPTIWVAYFTYGFLIETTTHVNGEEEPRSVAESHNLNDVTISADKVQTQEASIQWNIVKNPLLYIYALTLPISDGSYTTCLMMVYPHATDIGIPKFKAVFLLSLVGICGGVSRLVTGWFADLNYVKKKHIYQTATLANGILFCLFPFAKRYVGLAVMSGLCGVFAGSIVVLAPVLLAEELGLVNMPVTSSVMYSTSAFVMLGLNVLAGFLRDVTGDWNESFLVIGSSSMVAAIINLAEPLAARYGRR